MVDSLDALHSPTPLQTPTRPPTTNFGNPLFQPIDDQLVPLISEIRSELRSPYTHRLLNRLVALMKHKLSLMAVQRFVHMLDLGAEDPDPEAPSLVSFPLSAMHDLLLDPDFGRSQERTTPAVKDMYAVKAAQRKMCIDNLRDLTKGVDI